MKQKIMAKVMAMLALGAIVIGIVGTGIIFLMSASSQKVEKNITREELDNIIQQFSGSIDMEGSDNQVIDIVEVAK